MRDISSSNTDLRGLHPKTDLLENVDLHLFQEVQGTLYQSRGTVVFPIDPFVGGIAVSDAIVAGTSLGPWETTQVLTQATGSISRGQLTLNLTLNVAGGVFTMAITTN